MVGGPLADVEVAALGLARLDAVYPVGTDVLVDREEVGDLLLGVGGLGLGQVAERTPEAVVEFIPYYPALPTPLTPKTPKMSAAARVAIHLERMDPPPHPMVLSTDIKPGGFIVLRINARFVHQPVSGPDLHFIFPKDVDVTEEPWQLNDFAKDTWALGKFASGCVKRVTVAANDKLMTGTFPIKIYTVEPDDDSNAKERPHAIVNLTVKPSKEDNTAETGGSAPRKRKDVEPQNEVSALNTQLSSYAAVLDRPNTYAKAVCQDSKKGKKMANGLLKSVITISPPSAKNVSLNTKCLNSI